MTLVSFSASMNSSRGDPRYPALKNIYSEIINSLQSRGFEVYTSHIEDSLNVPGVSGESEKKDRAIRNLKHIRQADMAVIEASLPSSGVGFEVSEYIQKRIPMLFLIHRELSDPAKISDYFIYAKDLPESQVGYYSSKNELERYIDRFITFSGLKIPRNAM